MALVSTGVSKMVAAIILMGDPRHVNGLPYNVGNATAGGVSLNKPLPYFGKSELTENISLRRVQLATNALPLKTSFKRTVMLRILFVRRGIVRQRIRATDASMDRLHCSSYRAS